MAEETRNEPDIAVQAPQDAHYSAPFGVNISFPEAVVIKMVDASALNDYEFGLFVSSVLFSAFIGFLVAWFQAPTDAKLFAAIAAICLVLAISFFAWALRKRRKMTARSREFKLKTSGVEEVR